MSSNVNSVFRAIADPTRREIFHVLVGSRESLTINEISAHFAMSRQGVTKHLKMLEEAKLVNIHSRGRKRVCRANARPLMEIKDWVSTYEKFWEDAFSSLSAYLDEGEHPAR